LLQDHSALEDASLASLTKRSRERTPVAGMSSALLSDGDELQKRRVVFKADGNFYSAEAVAAGTRPAFGPTSAPAAQDQLDADDWWALVSAQAKRENVKLGLDTSGQVIYAGNASEKLKQWLWVHSNAVVTGLRSITTAPWIAV
jgi:hypothetical protein